MAYSRYATEMKDGDNNIYGLMDEEAREQLSDLNSAFTKTDVYFEGGFFPTIYQDANSMVSGGAYNIIVELPENRDLKWRMGKENGTVSYSGLQRSYTIPHNKALMLNTSTGVLYVDSVVFDNPSIFVLLRNNMAIATIGCWKSLFFDAYYKSIVDTEIITADTAIKREIKSTYIYFVDGAVPTIVQDESTMVSGGTFSLIVTFPNKALKWRRGTNSGTVASSSFESSYTLNHDKALLLNTSNNTVSVGNPDHTNDNIVNLLINNMAYVSGGYWKYLTLSSFWDYMKYMDNGINVFFSNGGKIRIDQLKATCVSGGTYSIKVNMPSNIIRYIKDGSGTNVNVNASYTLQHNQVLLLDTKTNSVYVGSASEINRYKLPLVACYMGNAEYGKLQFDTEYIDPDAKYDHIPTWYDTYLAGKIADIIERECTIGQGCEEFVFITDTHLNDNRCPSFQLIKKVIEKTNVNKIIFGGDAISSNGTLTDALRQAQIQCDGLRNAQGAYANLYNVKGNHDILVLQPEELLASDATGFRYFGGRLKGVNFNGNDPNQLYYWFDAENGYRYIILDCFQPLGSAGISPTQMDWFIDVLEHSDNKKIIICVHAGLTADVWSSAIYIHPATNGIVTAYNNRTTFTYTGTIYDFSYDISVDFTHATSKIILVMSGHTHEDKQDEGSNGAVNICTRCDALYNDDGLSPVADSVTEGSFDVVTIDPTNKKIYCTRIGAGSDREFSY